MLIYLIFFPLFQEWVTDIPFIISPRITFEVSVRLLGGLMALGYTIATILKRSSHIFSNNRVCVKIDWLEQLNRKYIQVHIVFNIHAVIVCLFPFSFIVQQCRNFRVWHALAWVNFSPKN